MVFFGLFEGFWTNESGFLGLFGVFLSFFGLICFFFFFFFFFLPSKLWLFQELGQRRV
jgi:hypothetical protein